MQNSCAITTQIESSICNLVEQNDICYMDTMHYKCNYILFEEAVSKSNFILTLLYLRIHMLMHYFIFGFYIDLKFIFSIAFIV